MAGAHDGAGRVGDGERRGVVGPQQEDAGRLPGSEAAGAVAQAARPGAVDGRELQQAGAGRP